MVDGLQGFRPGAPAIAKKKLLLLFAHFFYLLVCLVVVVSLCQSAQIPIALSICFSQIKMFLSRAKQFCRFSLFTHAANYCKRQGASIVVARKIYSAMTSAMVVPSRPTVLQLLPRYQYKSKFCTSSKKKVVFDKSMENHLGNMKR